MKQAYHKSLAVLLAIVLIAVAFGSYPVRAAGLQDGAADLGTIEYVNPLYAPESTAAPQALLPSADAQAISIKIDDAVIANIRAQMKQRKATITVELPFCEEYSEVAHYLIDTAVNTHTQVPTEGDYLKFQYGGWGCSMSTDGVTITYTYQMTYYTTAAQEKTVDTAVTQLLNTLNIRYKNDYQKVKAVYEWIAKNVSYDHGYATNPSDLIYSAYGAIIDRKAVCQGYSILFYRLMLELGVDCRIISGMGNGEAHGWNIVKLNGKYYNVDTTWASTTGYPQLFFLLGSKNFQDHQEGAEFKTKAFTKAYPIDVNDYQVTSEDLNTGDVDDGLPFFDVEPGKYFYDAVVWAYYHDPQITTGVDVTHFGPNQTCTRGQVVTFLWRAKGCPEPKMTANPFTDVKKSAFYYKAVLWAVENKITTGTSPTTFGPNDDCTRGHVVTFLYRANGSPAVSGSNPFKDVKSDAFYYKPVLWAVGKKITTGTSSTTFSPGESCTRGQVVTFLYRSR